MIHQKAVALVHSFAKNHGFADGNKRSALYAADLLIQERYRLSANSQDVEDMILAVVEDRMNYSLLEEWFKKRLTR